MKLSSQSSDLFSIFSFNNLKAFKERFGSYTWSCNQFHNSQILVIFVVYVKDFGKVYPQFYERLVCYDQNNCPYPVKGDNGYLFSNIYCVLIKYKIVTKLKVKEVNIY